MYISHHRVTFPINEMKHFKEIQLVACYQAVINR